MGVRRTETQPQRWQEHQAIASPHAAANGAKDLTEPALCLLLPSMDVARYLANADAGIGRRAGAKLSADKADGGFSVLRISGTPEAVACACYCVQEALWMSGAYF